ncbi:MAG: hypothetical protein WD875_03295 [Pirellulales bacterium]
MWTSQQQDARYSVHANRDRSSQPPLDYKASKTTPWSFLNMHLARRFASFMLAVLVCSLVAAPASAHFPWLAIDDEGHALYFFGEHVADRTYRMPERIKSAKIFHVDKDGKRSEIEFEGVETDKFIGNRSAAKIAETGSLHSIAEYGIYANTKLTYYTQHLLGKDAASWPNKPAADVALQGIAKKDTDGVSLQVFWQGKPLAGAKVQLFCDEGHEEGSATTNGDGVVQFTAKQVEDGLNGLLVGHVDNDSPGESNGKKYTGESHYLTITCLD